VASPVAPLPHRGRARPRPYYSPRPGWGASTDPVLLRVCAATLPASTRWWNSWRGSSRGLASGSVPVYLLRKSL
jgi:hypothetical protein